MNDQLSPLHLNDDERSCSPKRKKLRQKYAPKACVSCRRSKLKCSGENPCQRCRDNGKRCFFSEDQTAAEALQNLSRPSISLQPSTSASISNGSGLARRNIMPRHQNNERRASDASALGLSMEARMARVEAMMQALLQERAMYTTPNGSMERDESGNDTAMSMPMLDPINPALALLGQLPQTSHPQEGTTPAIDPLLDTDTITLRVGNRGLVFPAPIVYQGYINTFFRELQIFHPCVDEQLFRVRSEHVLAKAEVHPDDTCFLALNYVIFALHDVLTKTTEPSPDNKLAGWHWLQLADDVVGMRQLYGHGDLSLAQFLLFKALYCTLVDQPSLAYNTIGLASRYVLQQGLNRQTSFAGSGMWEIYERSRVFWNILVTDRRISLSCGRPYTIRDADIDVERPSDMYQRDVFPNLQPSESRVKHDESDSANAFLDCMIHWSRFAGSLWDSLLAAHVFTDPLADKIATFDAAIVDFFDNTFQELKTEIHPLHRQQYIRMSFDNLQLMARRAMIMSLQFDRATIHVCSRLAMDTITHVQAYETNAKYSMTSILRHHMIPSLASSLLLLCSLLVSDLSSLGLSLANCVPVVHQTFNSAVDLLHDLAREIPLARRVLMDFEKIVTVVQTAIAKWSEETRPLQGTPDWSIVSDVIPLNVSELLPYREQVPDIRFSQLYKGMWATNAGYSETDHGFSTWNEDLEPGGARCSVLWI
ncbi:hypothetical protein BU25DRAFT_375634 [Macroventuria anomochaeta]|uniref:Uncharacterized protein n=1 Tax=Macroventuria anomochaeta TaxID=301207 RepID=A0ACB6RP45_9PLEO|nr:uncharacterized protein BU25DRAFT_375634 [Macroventuria anomochaeta]KAF2623492.1 hypothetical protein BU25DRAFT_375634 [Macroventuria anomochaeta]